MHIWGPGRVPWDEAFVVSGLPTNQPWFSMFSPNCSKPMRVGFQPEIFLIHALSNGLKPSLILCTWGQCGTQDAAIHSCQSEANHFGWGLLWDGPGSVAFRNTSTQLQGVTVYLNKINLPDFPNYTNSLRASKKGSKIYQVWWNGKSIDTNKTCCFKERLQEIRPFCFGNVMEIPTYPSYPFRT